MANGKPGRPAKNPPVTLKTNPKAAPKALSSQTKIDHDLDDLPVVLEPQVVLVEEPVTNLLESPVVTNPEPKETKPAEPLVKETGVTVPGHPILAYPTSVKLLEMYNHF